MKGFRTARGIHSEAVPSCAQPFTGGRSRRNQRASHGRTEDWPELAVKTWSLRRIAVSRRSTRSVPTFHTGIRLVRLLAHHSKNQPDGLSIRLDSGEVKVTQKGTPEKGTFYFSCLYSIESRNPGTVSRMTRHSPEQLGRQETVPDTVFSRKSRMFPFQRPRRASSACRISAGRGGQPGIRRSTGMCRSTGPVTA